MKKEIRNKKRIMKSCVAAALTLVFVLGGISIVPNKEMDTVEASDATSTYVWKDLTYQKEAPICETEGYFFGGWYEADKETPVVSPVGGTTYCAKFVPANVMSVKCQVTSGTKAETSETALRIITTVDSLDYKEVGFDVTFNLSGTPKTKRCSTTSVLKAINVDNSGAGVFKYSPNIFDIASCYYTTITITGITDKMHKTPFLIEPYWITADGTEVQGISRYMRIEDSYAANSYGANGYLNVPVYLNDDAKIGSGTKIIIDRKLWSMSNSVATSQKQYQYIDFDAGELVESENISVKEDGTKIIINITGDGSVQAKGLLVNLRLQPLYSLSEMQSRFLFEGTGNNGTESICVLDIFHRNLLAAKNADYGWQSDSTIIIATKAELKGFVEYSGNKTYANKTIYLATDFDWNPNWTVGDDTPANLWTPISQDTTFQGTFDGQNHTIRGLYSSITSTYERNGFFGNVAGTVKNLVLDNCCFDGGTGVWSGAIAGELTGTIENVTLKNSQIKAANQRVGGIAGQVTGTVKDVKVQDSTIEGAHYVGGVTGILGSNGKVRTAYCDAAIKNSSTDKSAGGIVGLSSYNATGMEISDCWYAGKLSASQGGGILGHSNSSGITISHCLNTGEMEHVGTDKQMGGLIGFINVNSTFGRTLTLEDSLSLAKHTGDGGTYVGAIFGQLYGGNSSTDKAVVNNTYGIRAFTGNVSPGCTKAGYTSNNGRLVLNGTSYTGNVNITDQTVWVNEADINNGKDSAGGALNLSVDKGDGTDYWWIHTVGSESPRLKSFSDMPFKIAQYEQ